MKKEVGNQETFIFYYMFIVISQTWLQGRVFDLSVVDNLLVVAVVTTYFSLNIMLFHS
jgi:hypothetical protein